MSRVRSESGRALALALALIAVAAWGCSSSKPLPPEFDPTADFYRYRVYSWTSVPREGSSDQALLDWRIRNAVDGELALKGYRKRVAGEAPDFGVGYRLKLEEAEVDTFRDYYDYRRKGGAGGVSEAYVEGFEEAVLILEIYDAGTRKRVWRAAAKAVVDPQRRKRQNERVSDAVREMLAGFPPR